MRNIAFSIVVLIATLTFLFLSSNIRPSSAQNNPGYWCPSYIQNTQARVQNNIQVPWNTYIQVGCEKSFIVGSFHNNTGQFASDTVLQVTGPNDYNAFFRNGDTAHVPSAGRYVLYVNTRNQFDPGRCSGTALIDVVCPVSTPTPPQPLPPTCNYGSTQARVQANDNSNWEQHLSLRCGDSFELGSFHNESGQLAGDTILRVQGPQGLNHTFSNDQKIRALYPGRYTLFVTTNGQTGPGCEQTATVDVSCPTDWWRL